MQGSDSLDVYYWNLVYRVGNRFTILDVYLMDYRTYR
jgi:hypothetical protein